MTRSASVLIVEDSLTQAERLRYYLEKQGYEVITARNGREALDAVAERPPDIVISDIVMPEMDGYELCRALKKDPELAHIPVVLLTGLSEPSDVINGLACGASDFLAKPYNEYSLMARIDRVFTNAELRATAAPADGVGVSFGGKQYVLKSDVSHSVDFLLSTFEDAVEKNYQLNEANNHLKEALAKISDLESRYRTLMDLSPAAVFVVGRDGVIWYANQAAEVLFQRDAEELKGTPFVLSLDGDELPNEFSLALPDGTSAIVEVRVVDTTWGDANANLASLWDVTENAKLREQLHDLAVTDVLTGLANRRGFLILGEQQMKLARRGRNPALLYIDLDDFKMINDTLGHKVGDEALVEIARLLKGAVRDSDIAARLGGDEFVCLFVDAEPGFATTACERLQMLVDRRNAASDAPFRLALSLGGIAHGPDDARDLEQLLAEADALMYADKQRRKAARRRASA
jgi:diguanylate cyclase (GGDEF)-like protein